MNGWDPRLQHSTRHSSGICGRGLYLLCGRVRPVTQTLSSGRDAWIWYREIPCVEQTPRPWNLLNEVVHQGIVLGLMFAVSAVTNNEVRRTVAADIENAFVNTGPMKDILGPAGPGPAVVDPNQGPEQ